MLSELEKFGFRIAIDDFGTGYSSLGVLLEIPADVVKIDKSFTDRINLKEQRNFVSQMGNFIHSAKEEVIFEGIETEEQLQFCVAVDFCTDRDIYLTDRFHWKNLKENICEIALVLYSQRPFLLVNSMLKYDSSR